MPEYLPFNDPTTDDQGRPVRPCIDCKVSLTFETQPGTATCPECGTMQYLTEPTRAWPTGGLGRDWAP
jgi:predicted RNA-binding Zn-ribbon protein involved in translation (DUF1610 family)